ncbi:MAG TPA: MBL fold metallo-hydrolase [Terriglobales bacterium]|nr:MBL fold metallo-hydrolase [Terriglobales bacterium]
MLRNFFVVAAVLFLLSVAVAQPKAPSDALQVYFIDVEGGQATLFVTPQHESLLIDTGWPTESAKRIVDVAHKAGLSRIDYVLITHYHEDHVGGVGELVKMIPVGTFIDHGENRETPTPARDPLIKTYKTILADKQYKHLVLKPGDSLPIKGMESVVVSGDGNVIAKPLAGGGQKNAACEGSQKYPADQTENGRSLGVLFTFGSLRILDLGDLTSDRELALMCPVNNLGRVDIYIVSHHGWKESGSPALLRGISPRIAIMDNGAKKGGSPSAWDVIHSTSSVEDLWQLHYSEEGGASHNSPGPLIANLQGRDAGNYLELIASPDGGFDVYNSRTQRTKHYRAREQ